ICCKKAAFKFFVVRIFWHILFVSSFLLGPFAKAEVMFEGYYQIKLGSVHSGFVIQQYSFDNKKKLFSSTYYIKTNQLAGDITESLKATANDKFEPVSYQYTSKTGNTIKTIDASFKNNKMMAVVSDGKLGNKVEFDLPKGTFLSTFLAYMMLSRGISKGKVYNYKGLAEEDAKVYDGKALIQQQEDKYNLTAYKILNEFKGTKFISTMTDKAEVLDTKSPVQQIETVLVKTPAEATKGFQVNSKTLRLLFGRVPSGKINQLTKANSKGP
ncbi:MAG: hypothetical protein KDD58_08850, partial [Bdellovibrionales bacterium]|nr:hypothetical protein [Bdellovibrionales bacterium]